MAAAHRTGPANRRRAGIRQLLHLATGMIHAGRGRYRESLEEFSAAERLQSQLRGPTRWRAR